MPDDPFLDQLHRRAGVTPVTPSAALIREARDATPQVDPAAMGPILARMTPPELVSFLDCLVACVDEPAFVQQFNRLTGAQVGPHACEADLRRFTAFVYDVVWCRLPPVP